MNRQPDTLAVNCLQILFRLSSLMLGLIIAGIVLVFCFHSYVKIIHAHSVTRSVILLAGAPENSWTKYIMLEYWWGHYYVPAWQVLIVSCFVVLTSLIPLYYLFRYALSDWRFSNFDD